jgi:predicted metal-dependent peptidase
MRLPEAAFYSSLMMQLLDSDANSRPDITTAGTDGKNIYWCESWLAGLTDEQTRFVLLHEALHCAHRHWMRLPHDSTANEAGDYAINWILHGSRLPIAMPKGGLLDAEFRDKAEEEIYGILKAQPKRPQQPDTCGGYMEPAGATAQEKQATAQAWSGAIVAAAMAAKARGQGKHIPEAARRLIGEITAQARVDWRLETAEFIKSAAAERSDWMRSARRHATAAVIMPRRQRTIERIACIVDTSGSIDAGTMAEFLAVARQAAQEIGCSVRLIAADSDIRYDNALQAGDIWPTELPGGGGTDFRPAVRAAEADEAVAGIVYLTDLCGCEPDGVEKPILWLSTTGCVAATGRTIRI